jgi:hypothetical protein
LASNMMCVNLTLERTSSKTLRYRGATGARFQLHQKIDRSYETTERPLSLPL